MLPRSRSADRPNRTDRRAGFTLIEVLVVVAIIALLVAILIPSLKQAKEAAAAVVCRSGMHQVTVAMHSYVTSSLSLPGTNGVFWTSFLRAGKRGWPQWKASDSWLGILDPSTQFTTAMQEQLWAHVAATVPQQGSLYKYVKDDNVYLCTRDKKGYPNPEDPAGGGGNGRFSYTMNGFLGFRKPESVGSFTYVEDFETKAGALKPKVAMIPKGRTIKWSQSQMPLLFEEHPWNNTNHGIPGDDFAADAYLVLRHYPQKTKGKANFLFLDGHGEMRLYPWISDFSRTGGAKLQGIDIYNEYMFPYNYDGNAGGKANEEAFVKTFPYPYDQ
ncbi:MAG: type II secretion system protein [Planctomycetes bacterium]|nr:type II secretion system protein [Planctomycetota bacterium]